MVNCSDGSVNHSVVEIQPAAVGGRLGFGGAMTADGKGDDNGTAMVPLSILAHLMVALRQGWVFRRRNLELWAGGGDRA